MPDGDDADVEELRIGEIHDSPDRGFRVRYATAQDIPSIARVHVDSWNQHYRGLLDDRLIDERTVEVRIAVWNKAFDETERLTYVAEGAGGRLLGFASAHILTPGQKRFDSYLQQLYLLSDAKGRGIGRALLRVLAAALIRRNCESMALRVLRQNPAHAFYERLGARPVPEGIENDEGFFDDVVYAFDDLKALL
jgi:ribosomal protein S18 acetylase RimI-like enzyme